ncbi:hypothetical protein [Paraburkholderia sp. BL17N1]|uniref:hypothetical protein n=1 Tax=Paraburkholderia sp. BL17N1 TaxID=1938798 RepID=UPI000EAD5F92|nr:hypothetical protein [Paraburkholderia sp. BL17N1]RKR37654.1 hypothetical protein B0G82_5748 [Paraburkholderia sp. BL17N1]
MKSPWFTFWAFAALVALLCLTGCSPREDNQYQTLAEQPCEARPEYRSQLNIVLLDRTSRLSKQDLIRWRKGIDSLFLSDAVEGRVELLDITGSGDLAGSPTTLCYVEVIVPGGRPRADDADKPMFEKAKAALQDWRFGSPEQDDPSPELITERLTNRREQREALKQAAERDVPAETPTTDILLPVGEGIAERCRQVTSCRVFAFTDLIDTEVRKKVANMSLEQATALGQVRAQELLAGHLSGDSKIPLTVIVWGAGRDEKGNNAALSVALERRLVAFWEGYFQTVCKAFGKGSGVSIGLEAPESMPTSCR